MASSERSSPTKNTVHKPVTEDLPVVKESADDPVAEKPAEQPALEPAAIEDAKPQTELVVAEARLHGAGILTPDLLDSPDPVVPSVALSDQHAATCLVKVGDAMPGITLADINGDRQDVAKLLGEQLTIVLFWSPENRRSVEELNDLAYHVASPLHARGVRVVSICEQATAETAKQIAERAGASFPVLLDTDGAALSHIATGMLPRTYVLDPTGKVLWFDIEYSHAMWREFREVLRALVPAEDAAAK